MSPPAGTLQRMERLAPLSEVLARLDALARPVAPRRTRIDQAPPGAVLAADVRAPESRPAKAVAIVDGWAARAESVADAGPYSPVPLAAPVWVEVGDRLPEGVDAILPPDAVSAHGTSYEAVGAVAPGEGVLAAGGNAEAGAVLLRRGSRLRASDVAALTALGVTGVEVRAPSIRIVPVHAQLGHGIVAALLARAVGAGGGAAESAEAEPLEQALLSGSCDAVFVVGGTGQGKRDASVTTLARLGRVVVHGFGISPGESGAIGEAGGRPVLLFPGRLDAALAVWLMIGAPLLDRLTDATASKAETSVRLIRKIASTVGIAELVLLRRTEGGVEPLGSRVLSLSALAAADGWIVVPPESEGFAAGTTVSMRALP
jgi:molybdopterin biosynthesis enzyme